MSKPSHPEKNVAQPKPPEANKTLKSATTEELIRELEADLVNALLDLVHRQALGRRRAEANVEANRRALHNMEFVLQNANELLDLVPRHDCMSCTDDAPGNFYSDAHGHPRCTRCRLLSILHDKMNDGTVLLVQLRDWKPLDTDEAALRVIAPEEAHG